MESKTDDVLTKAAFSKRFGIPEGDVDEWAKAHNVPICTFAGESVYIVTNIQVEQKQDDGIVLLQKRCRARKTIGDIEPYGFSGVLSTTRYISGGTLKTFLQIVAYAGDKAETGEYQVGYDDEVKRLVLQKVESGGYEFRRYKGFRYRRFQVHIPIEKIDPVLLRKIEQYGGRAIIAPTEDKNGNIYLFIDFSVKG